MFEFRQGNGWRPHEGCLVTRNLKCAGQSFFSLNEAHQVGFQEGDLMDSMSDGQSKAAFAGGVFADGAAAV